MDGVVSFQHWGPGEPSGGSAENCAVINLEPSNPLKPPGFWSTEECNGSKKFRAICEEIIVEPT